MIINNNKILLPARSRDVTENCTQHPCHIAHEGTHCIKERVEHFYLLIIGKKVRQSAAMLDNSPKHPGITLIGRDSLGKRNDIL